MNKTIKRIETELKLDPEEATYFYQNAKRYIKAIKDGRMCCIIESVSSSGMSRTLKFMECSGGKHGYSYLNFYNLFKNLGYTKVKNSDCFRVHGCGMDMVFATNYNICHQLKKLGIITKKTCDKLAQKTPITL